jgi:hypothetical protein
MQTAGKIHSQSSVSQASCDKSTILIFCEIGVERLLLFFMTADTCDCDRFSSRRSFSATNSKHDQKERDYRIRRQFPGVFRRFNEKINVKNLTVPVRRSLSATNNKQIKKRDTQSITYFLFSNDKSEYPRQFSCLSHSI